MLTVLLATQEGADTLAEVLRAPDRYRDIFLDAESKLEYVVAMAKDAALKRKARPPMRHARKLSRQRGETER